MSQTDTRSVSRPAQGAAPIRKPPGPAYAPEPAPSIVSRGTVSRPVPLKKWNPGTLPQDRPGKIVQR